MVPQQPFQIGEHVYFATAGAYRAKNVTCPACFGTQKLTLILGDGEHVDFKCDNCEHATMHGRPRGTVVAYGVDSEVNEGDVTGVTLSRFENEKWEVYVGSRIPDRTSISRTREEAEAHRLVLHAVAEKYQKEQEEENYNRGRAKSKRSFSVTYHRNCIAKLEREMQYHRDQLLLAPKKEKP